MVHLQAIRSEKHDYLIIRWRMGLVSMRNMAGMSTDERSQAVDEFGPRMPMHKSPFISIIGKYQATIQKTARQALVFSVDSDQHIRKAHRNI
jgi:hypothetical protein